MDSELDGTTMKEPEELTFLFLREITEGFLEMRKVGEGAFGAVYRGLTKNREHVAVKILRDDGEDLDYRQFRNEFYNLRKVKHKNIVQVLGYCFEIEPISIEYHGRIVSAEKTHKALCFEYLHNGSLQSHLSEFRLQGYYSVIFPYWMSRVSAYLPGLTSIDMSDLPSCNNLPPLGQLPKLMWPKITRMDSIKKIDMDLYGGPRAFPRLDYFRIDGNGMKCLDTAVFSLGEKTFEISFKVY